MPEGAAPGIGGVFLRCRDPEALKSWYQQQLDLPAEEGGVRVADLDTTLERMRAAGAALEGEVEECELGRFGHVTDPEGNRIELWEPAPDL